MSKTNSDTEHSRELRKETAAKRRARILDEGGLDFRALIEKSDHDKLLALLQWYSRSDDDKVTKTDLFKRMLNEAYNALPMQAKNDQLDILADKNVTPEATKNRPPIKYKLKDHTWTGRGRKPMWVLDYLQSGGKLEDIEAD